MTDPRPLYVFIDESGNLDFTGSGTDHFVLTARLTDDPEACAADLAPLKYEYLARGLHEQIPFHATVNSHGTRKRVIESLCSQSGRPHACQTRSVYVDKHLAHPSKHDPAVFYGLLGGALAKFPLKAVKPEYSPIVLMFDSALTRKHRGAFLKTIRPELNALNRKYFVAFKPVKEDLNGQIADYYAWSLFRKLEHNDDTYYNQLPGRHDTFNLFRRGHTRYW